MAVRRGAGPRSRTVVRVGKGMQDRHHRQGDRLREVQEVCGLPQDLVRVTDVRGDVQRGGHACEQLVRMGQHDRVVVDVYDSGVRCDGLGAVH
jgi:hypothetical protein